MTSSLKSVTVKNLGHTDRHTYIRTKCLIGCPLCYRGHQKYRKDIQDSMNDLLKTKQNYDSRIKKYENVLAKITKNSNEILDIWANTYPKKLDENSSDYDKEVCKKFQDQMKTCVSCKSTIRRDLNLLSKNWKYVERDGINIMGTIKDRRRVSKRVKNMLKGEVI